MKKYMGLLLFSVTMFISANSAFSLSPAREYQALPSDYGIIYRDMDIMTEDSLIIKGWFYPAQDTSGIQNQNVGRFPVPEPYKSKPREYKTIDESPRPTVVICDGDSGNMTYLIIYAYNLTIRGFNVLTFDWRGFGHSDSWATDKDQLCYTEYLLDYDAAVYAITKEAEVDSTRIGVFGFSTGAYLSFAIASRNENVSVFAGRALITSFSEVAPILKNLDPDRPLLLPEDYPEELQPINAAGDLTKPAFLIVGENDDRTPVQMSKRVYDKLLGKKELWIVEGADHGGANAPEFIDYPVFFDRLARFFDEHLK